VRFAGRCGRRSPSMENVTGIGKDVGYYYLRLDPWMIGYLVYFVFSL
jgi:hypothetical protein